MDPERTLGEAWYPSDDGAAQARKRISLAGGLAALLQIQFEFVKLLNETEHAERQAVFSMVKYGLNTLALHIVNAVYDSALTQESG